MPDNSKSDNPIIRNAWQRGLDVLKPSAAQLEHGLELHENLFTCDNFSFVPSLFTDEVVKLWNELQAGDAGSRETSWRAGLARVTGVTRDEAKAAEFLGAIRASGLNCMVQTVAEGKSREEDIKRMALHRQLYRVFRKYIRQVGSSTEAAEARADGCMGLIWSVNGPPTVGKLADRDEELSWVETWYNLGVRLMHLTYNRRNFIGDGCAEPANGGLSELGRDLVGELNRVGIVVDVPHSGKQTTLDAAWASQKPVMASHTGAEAVFKHIRCKSDEEIKAITDTDGLLGVYVLPNMLGPDANLTTMLDHVDYIAKLAGADHVAIGTDCPYQAPWPEGVTGFPNARFKSTWWGNWNSENHPLPHTDEASAGSLAWTNWPLYTVGLVTRGYSDDDIAKIVGGNLMRVLDANRPVEEVEM